MNKPADATPLSSRFVFKLTLDADGGVERFKGRLVARGDQSIEGVNYQYKFKDLGIVTMLLGMKLEYETDCGYSLSHQVMIANLVESFGMQGSKPVSTPIAEVVLSADDTELISAEAASLLRTLAGTLLWITRCTRPDIEFAVHKMTRWTHAPRMCDFKMGKRMIRYLNGTSNYRLNVAKTIDGPDLQFEVYTDVD